MSQVIDLQNVSVVRSGKAILDSVTFTANSNERWVILGSNGAGKTTMLRMLAGLDTPDTGKIVPGHGLKIGYYAQEHESLDFERTILENMMSATPDIGEPEARNTLGSFLFVGDDVHKPVKVLSGGERTRLALLHREHQNTTRLFAVQRAIRDQSTRELNWQFEELLHGPHASDAYTRRHQDNASQPTHWPLIRPILCRAHQKNHKSHQASCQ